MRNMKKHILCSVPSVSDLYRGLQDVWGIQSSLNIHPTQNWRIRSNTEKFLGSDYPPFHPWSKNFQLPVREKGVFCRSTSQVKFMLGKGLWRCPSSCPNPDFRVCEERAFA